MNKEEFLKEVLESFDNALYAIIKDYDKYLEQKIRDLDIPELADLMGKLENLPTWAQRRECFKQFLIEKLELNKKSLRNRNEDAV